MRLIYALPMLMPLVACTGDGSDNPNTDTDTGVTNAGLDFTFRNVVPADEFQANISQNVVDAHQMTNTLLGGMGVVSSDSAVRDLYNADGDGGLRGILACWERPPFPRWEFTMNFGTSSCSNFGMDGAVSISDHPAGVLLFNFSSFQIQGRTMGGSFALDRTGANPESLFWVAYNTGDESPGPENRVQLGITTQQVPKGLTYDGGVNVNLVQGTFNAWGEATISGDPPITVVHGATEAGIVAPDEPPGADAVTLPLTWTQCRCPVSGITSLDMPLEINEVSIDIDTLQTEDDGFDDAVLDIPVQATINGRAVLGHTGCGQYDVSFEPADAANTFEVDSQLLFARTSFLCDTRAIKDPERCDAIFRAITDLGPSVTVEVTQADLDRTADEAVANDFDTTWCQVKGG